MDDKQLNHLLSSIKQICGDNSITPLHEPTIGQLEKQYVQDCLDSGWISSAGKYVDDFEKSLQNYTGVKYAIATVNGTSALHICLLLAGVKANEEVLIPNLTFIATANAVCYTSAIPHLIDVSMDTLGVDPVKLRIYLEDIGELRLDGLYNKNTGNKISTLIVMHTYGHPCDMDELLIVCKKFNLKLIEDAAESLGSFYHGKHTGQFGESAALSFNGNKIISSGGGGAILTNNSELAAKAKHLTTTAKIPGTISSEHDYIAYNYRLPNINAALGLAQIESLPNKLVNKRLLAKKYQQTFASENHLKIFEEPKNCRSNYWLNLLLLNKPCRATRDKLITKCQEIGIYTRPVWGLMHRQVMFHQNPHMPNLEISERLFDSIICLPSSPQLISHNE